MSFDHNHNADRFSAVWGNLDCMKGLAKGGMISDSGIAGGWSWKDDGVGGGAYSYDPSHSGSQTWQVEQANLLHWQLLALWNGDRSLRNTIADFVVKNNDLGSSWTFHNMRISKPPPFDLSTESPTVPWVMLYTNVTYVPVVTQANVIGSGFTPTLPAGP